MRLYTTTFPKACCSANWTTALATLNLIRSKHYASIKPCVDSSENSRRAEPSGDSDMDFPVSSHRSHLDLPPLSPISDCSSSSFSYRDASSSRPTSPVFAPSTPLSSHDSTTLSHVKYKTTFLFPKPDQIHDCDLSDFLEDDDAIATQLSQQPSTAELAPEVLEDMIQEVDAGCRVGTAVYSLQSDADLPMSSVVSLLAAGHRSCFQSGKS
jgi:hypothetical protein